MQTVTDARGATQTFTYNSRHLVTGINYVAAGTAVATPNVSYAYDAAGNRTSMTDGLGSVTYGYEPVPLRNKSHIRNSTLYGSFVLSSKTQVSENGS